MSRKIKNNGKHSSFLKLTQAEGAAGYRELREEVVKAGILDRSYGYYAVLITFIFLGFFFSAYNIYRFNSPWLLVLWSIIFAFFNIQIGGLLHDAGHRAIFASSKMNDIAGYIFGATITKRYSKWRTNHNRHHAHPNQDEEDPDIEIPFSFTEDRYKGRKGFIGLIRRYQAYLYFPFGSLVAFRMRIDDIESFIKNFMPRLLPEITFFLIGFFIVMILPFFIFPLAKAFLVVMVVNLTAGLYLLNVFAPNHKGMPEFEKGVKVSFLEQQVIASRNINGHWLTDIVYMGLNYQIEHHLFPNTPRNKLKLLTPYVVKLCKKYGFDYTSVNVVQTNVIIISELNQVAKAG